MKTINLEELGVSELDKRALVKTNGGLVWLPITVTAALIISFINSFGDVRQGLVDGWRGTPRYVD